MDLNIKIDKIMHPQDIRHNSLYSMQRCRLQKYLLCFLVGRFPEDIPKMLYKELLQKTGIEAAQKLVSIDRADCMVHDVEQALGYFRKNIEGGIIQMNLACYVPVIFMADQLDAESMHQSLEAFRKRMERAGFASKCQIVYYCIFNYEYMDAKLCHEQLQQLQAGQNYPICILTHSCQYATEYLVYLKAVQAMAMHIFLQLVPGMENHGYSDFLIPGKKFVVGCWKHDVMKQKAVEYLLYCMEQQNKELYSEIKYTEIVREQIDCLVNLDDRLWLGRMCSMPVDYRKLETKKNSLSSSNGESISNIELLRMLYGREDIFTAFVSQNIEAEGKNISIFMNGNIGNLEAINNMLPKSLDILQNLYLEQREALGRQWQRENTFVMKRNSTLLDVQSHLIEKYWNKEWEQIVLNRKILFIESIVQYLNSDMFRERKIVVGDKVREKQAQLYAILQAFSIPGERLLNMEKFKIDFSRMAWEPGWDDSLSEKKFLQGLSANISNLQKEVKIWINKNFYAMLGDFISGLKGLKSNNQLDLYYAARLCQPNNMEEKEFLYIGSGMIGRENRMYEKEEIQRIVKAQLPKAEIYVPNWGTEMCLEFFSMKEIEDYTEVYGMGFL